MKVYLAGPMSNQPQFNFPAFMSATEYLRNQGYEVFNPAEEDIRKYGKKDWMDDPEGNPEEAKKNGFNLRETLGMDLNYICQFADAVAFLPGWEESKGALAEFYTARALGHKFFLIEEGPEGQLWSHREVRYE